MGSSREIHQLTSKIQKSMAYLLNNAWIFIALKSQLVWYIVENRFIEQYSYATAIEIAGFQRIYSENLSSLLKDKILLRDWSTCTHTHTNINCEYEFNCFWEWYLLRPFHEEWFASLYFKMFTIFIQSAIYWKANCDSTDWSYVFCTIHTTH